MEALTKMATFTTREMWEMTMVYGECHQHSQEAARVYAQRFSNSRPVSQQVLGHIMRCLQATCSFNPQRHTGRPVQVTRDANVAVVLAFFMLHPHAGTSAAAACRISQSSVVRVLHRFHYHNFHIHLHQALRPGDHCQQVDFCNWILNAIDDQRDFLKHILWIDDSQFTRDGIVNIQNAHYWSPVNPHWMREIAHQVRWHINVWCGIINTTVVGPVFYEGTITAQSYLQLLTIDVDDFIDDAIPLQALPRLWLQQDGAPLHYVSAVVEYLNEQFPDRWIGRGGTSSKATPFS